MNLLNQFAIRNTFKAYERLKREQHIDTLFRNGKAFSVFPLKCIWLATARGDERSPVRAGFSVPKKKFRRSVDRHRIIRLMREAWRMSKHVLYEAVPADRQLQLFLIFTDKEMPGFDTIAAAMAKAIARLVQQQATQPDA